MTLIIAADVQDHLILAGDHCAVLSSLSNPVVSDVVISNYRKVYPWKYGAIAASGDVFLVAGFCRLFLRHQRCGGAVDLRLVASEAKQLRTRAGVPRCQSTGNIFFTLPGQYGFELHSVCIGDSTVEYEHIAPISTRLSLREACAPDVAVCQAFNRQLRPLFWFKDRSCFHRHHLDLLAGLYRSQSDVDALVTSSFDTFILDKRTGVGTFWPGSPAARSRGRVHPQL